MEIIMPKYESFFLNNWSNKDSVIADFEGVYYNEDLTPEMAAKYANVEVLLASYGQANYLGDAFVLFRNTDDNALYEVSASHCSCFGLEDQWDPEPCDFDTLKKRVFEGRLGASDYSDNVFKDEIQKVIISFEPEYGNCPKPEYDEF